MNWASSFMNKYNYLEIIYGLQDMKKVVIVIICLTFFSVFSVNAFGQTMFLNPSEDSLIDIQN